MTNGEDLLQSGWPGAEVDVTRRRRPRRRLPRLIGALAALLVVAVIGTYLTLVLTAPLPAARVMLTPPSVVVPPLELASLSGFSTYTVKPLVGTAGSLTAIGGGEQGKRYPIASISKLITALVVLDKYPLAPGESGPTLTFSKADHNLYDSYYVRGATVQPMSTGSTMTLRDAIETMLIASASNYAEAVSSCAFGSPSGFEIAARAWTLSHQMTNTVIHEATGLDPRNAASMQDLMTLIDLAEANPVVKEIVGMSSADVPGIGVIANTNDLVGTHGVDGVKTGTLDEAGSCLLFTATVDSGLGPVFRVSGVVLAGESRPSVDADVVGVLDSVAKSVSRIDVITAGDRVGRATTLWGDSAAVVATSSQSIVTSGGFETSDVMNVDTMTRQIVTADKADEIGSIRFASGTQATTVALELDSAITAPDAWWRITHPQALFG